jgi:hypothetical protein
MTSDYEKIKTILDNPNTDKNIVVKMHGNSSSNININLDLDKMANDKGKKLKDMNFVLYYLTDNNANSLNFSANCPSNTQYTVNALYPMNTPLIFTTIICVLCCFMIITMLIVFMLKKK